MERKNMRYVFLLPGILIVFGIAHSEERVGLTHRPLPSPDGAHLVFISERRYNGNHEYTLSIRTARRGRHFSIGYSLTPRIHEVISSPDRKIVAYLAQDVDYWFGIYFYYIDTDKAFGFEWSSTGSNIEKFQFSKDQKYIRYYSTPSICDDGNVGKRTIALVVEKTAGKWVGMPIELLKGEPPYFYSKEEHAKIDWAPVEKPNEIPGFLTQRVPKIKKETQMQWSHDSKTLYLLDETGIWASNIGAPFIFQWNLIVRAPSISRFQLSPDGAHLLYEVAAEGEEERAIWILDVKPELSNPSEGEPRYVAKGWAATFSRDGSTFFYANFEGFYESYLNGTLHRPWNLTSYHP